MEVCWLNKKNNKNLIVFFAGWSFDQNPFKTLDCGDFDIIFVYDYNEISTFDIDVSEYKKKYLITWSMGVFVAYLMRHKFSDFDYKIAVNGTVSPVDNEFGIPVRMFELTLKHAQKGLEGKFYQNVFDTVDEYEKYLKSPVKRTIESRVNELSSLYSLIKNTDISFENFYNVAIVSEFDKIIPPQNQINSHKKSNTPVISLSNGHSPFYNYKSWKEIIELCQLI